MKAWKAGLLAMATHASAFLLPRANATNATAAASYTTVTVATLVTYCPSATTLTYGNATYTVPSATTLTITDCPCTLTQPVPASGPSTAAPGPALASTPASGPVSGPGPVVVNGTVPGNFSTVFPASLNPSSVSSQGMASTSGSTGGPMATTAPAAGGISSSTAPAATTTPVPFVNRAAMVSHMGFWGFMGLVLGIGVHVL